jgi:hypothetical protein
MYLILVKTRPNMHFSKRWLAACLPPLTCAMLFLTSCDSGKKEAWVAEGKSLTGKYCGNCHLAPDPSLLSKSIWTNNVLPAMAERLGIEVLEGNIYLHGKQSTISYADWNKIIKYYETLAPDTLPAPKITVKPLTDWSIFTLIKPAEQTDIVSSTMMVAIDSAKKNLLTSNSENNGLYRFDQNLKQQKIVQLSSAAIDVTFPTKTSDPAIVTSMGGMRALDNTMGQVMSIADKDSKPKMLATDLIRPINNTAIDFNKDGLTDYVVCAFGHNRGGLYILKQLQNGTFQKMIIRDMPGATVSHIRDFNKDGWPDIITLFAHGDEGIWLFTNDKKGGFTSKNILRFPPVYGSSSFQLADIDHDGKEDILYTAGDNSDYSRIFKPYHGLYIYTNTGNLLFKQTYFLPINGATKAMTADFDQDGDLDIATIAFFADFKNKPEETFTYLEQDHGKFVVHAIPVHQNGRWICMDVNDYDGDGDADIVLGNYSKGFLNQENITPNWNVHLPFVILKNNTVRTNAR